MLPYAAAAVGGSIGVGLGWVAGSAVGGQRADCGFPDSGSEFCGFEEFLIGGLIGGTLGAATGAYIGTRLAGGSPRPAVALAGTVLGLGTGFLVGRALEDLGFGARPVYVGAAIGQGAFTGLLTARFRRDR